ncbi:MAG TPA: hypothetical protein VLB83_05845 [Candidatus Paceibacterota bacterium]|nr:hypothetical protein [Candidatus Paceibacterota bacterium]
MTSLLVIVAGVLLGVFFLRWSSNRVENIQAERSKENDKALVFLAKFLALGFLLFPLVITFFSFFRPPVESEPVKIACSSGEIVLKTRKIYSFGNGIFLYSDVVYRRGGEDLPFGEPRIVVSGYEYRDIPDEQTPRLAFYLSPMNFSRQDVDVIVGCVSQHLFDFQALVVLHAKSKTYPSTSTHVNGFIYADFPEKKLSFACADNIWITISKDSNLSSVMGVPDGSESFIVVRYDGPETYNNLGKYNISTGQLEVSRGRATSSYDYASLCKNEDGKTLSEVFPPN